MLHRAKSANLNLKKGSLRQIGNIDTKGNNSIRGRVYDPYVLAVNLNSGGGGLGAKTGFYLDKDAKIRRLTPMEGERLQGFEDFWTKEGIDKNGNVIQLSDAQRYKCIGNAVTVNVIKAIGRKLMAEIR